MSRRLETLSLDRNLSEVQVETPNQDYEILPNVNTVVQVSLGGDKTRGQLVEHNQINTEIQTWTENFEKKKKDRIMKMREKMENKLEAILRRNKNK